MKNKLDIVEKRLVIVTSEYCLINILKICDENVVRARDIKLLLFDSFPTALELYKKLLRLGVFDSVYLVRCRTTSRRYELKKICLQAVKYRMKSNEVKEIWIGAHGSLAIMMFSFIIVMGNAKIGIVYYEEGFSSYTIDFDELALNEGINRWVYNNIINIDKRFVSPITIWLNRPDIAYKQYSCIEKIPKEFCMSSQAIYDELWREATSDLSKKYIFFGSYSVRRNLINLDAEKRILSHINQDGDLARQFLLKKHPRNDEQYYYENIEALTEPIAWEVMVRDSLSNTKVLISVMSTGTYAGNFIWERNDIIVFLYQILLDRTSQEYKGMEVFVTRLKKCGFKVYCPNNEAEFWELLKVI